MTKRRFTLLFFDRPYWPFPILLEAFLRLTCTDASVQRYLDHELQLQRCPGREGLRWVDVFVHPNRKFHHDMGNGNIGCRRRTQAGNLNAGITNLSLSVGANQGAVAGKPSQVYLDDWSICAVEKAEPERAEAHRLPE